MPTRELLKYKAEDNFKDFYERIKSLVPELERFMVASLKVSENQGKIDRQFYDPRGMLDEVYLDIFRNLPEDMDLNKLKHLLFEKSITKIDDLLQQEAETSTAIHADNILKQELNRLQEKWFVDVDGDLLLKTELDDISYKQDHQWSPPILLDEAVEQQLIHKLDLDESNFLSEEKRGLMGSVYDRIPSRSRHMLELFVFGDQTQKDISEIMHINEEKVSRMLRIMFEKFRLI
ncbi:hypothetical protein [Lentiprolixibacter aurantiacus]|uniref:Sigma-70 family RNA polymerase sigma factor n=1 Tax=Lentiprolixibacter aurantiacus TaxID=2993939 RepID=A0AAE3MPU5_9FLAO|nr:hypothetical protein [Lentiprolixibacter aurantiacus]MCX2720742.1 hypothetical protein [Lentiprolixibacter aurantiacus]